MDVFIRGVGNISPQNTIDNSCFLDEIIEYNDDYLKCVEPSYKEYINPALSRRLSRVIKMGVAAAKICLNDASVNIPGAIITGTGLGCIEDTDKFLSSMVENDERLMTPTSFIHSTHNSISAQIALLLKCNNYNTTYAHRGFSFESALHDCMLLFTENEVDNVLVGGIDEITPISFKITKRLGLWKDKAINNLELLKNETKGTIAGEGATYFLLANKTDALNYARIRSVSMIYKPENISMIETHITGILNNVKIGIDDIDLVVCGINGDSTSDHVYHGLFERLFTNMNCAYYKHLCGEYHTSSAFGMWLAANIIKRQTVPDVIKLDQFNLDKINNILIYNHNTGANHSLMLISKC